MHVSGFYWRDALRYIRWHAGLGQYYTAINMKCLALMTLLAIVLASPTIAETNKAETLQNRAAMANGMAALISEMPQALSKELPASSTFRFRNLTGGTYLGGTHKNLGYVVCGEINSLKKNGEKTEWAKFAAIRFPFPPFQQTRAYVDKGIERVATQMCSTSYLGIVWRWRGDAFLNAVTAQAYSNGERVLPPDQKLDAQAKSIPPATSQAIDLATSQTLSKETLLGILRDPNSADFRNVVAHEKTIDGKRMFVFCGELNSKNGFGGFTGYERFIATPVLSTMESASSDFDQSWEFFCKGAGQGPIWF